MNKIRLMGLATVVAALAVAPSVADAHRPDDVPRGKAQGQAKSKANGKRCTVQRGFVLKGTFVSGSGNTVELKVTKGNKHARAAGYDAGETHSFTTTKGVKYVGYETGEAADADDPVRLVGKIAYTKKRCAGGPSYGAVTARKARVKDND